MLLGYRELAGMNDSREELIDEALKGENKQLPRGYLRENICII